MILHKVKGIISDTVITFSLLRGMYNLLMGNFSRFSNKIRVILCGHKGKCNVLQKLLQDFNVKP